MAFIHSLIDDSQIKDPSLRAFLHQRTREWKYSDLTFDPLHCINMPDGYEADPKPETSLDLSSTTELAKHVCWSEDLPRPGPFSSITKALHHLALTVTTSKKEDIQTVGSDADTEWSTGQSAICPTFAGGDNSVGECVFTNPAVQRAILSFFEEVAQDPENYRNPNIKIYTEAPQPTPGNPLALSTDNPADIDFPSLQSEITPEQAELDEARQCLRDMRIALDACPLNVEELAKGCERLSKRIQDKEVEIEALEKKALGSGGLKAGEAMEKRENWKPQKEGPKVPFAGTMVDSELLKAAGMLDTAQHELEKLGEDDDQKAFI